MEEAGVQISAALGHVGLGWVKLAWIEVGVLWFDWIGVGLDSIDLHGIRAWCTYSKPFFRTDNLWLHEWVKKRLERPACGFGCGPMNYSEVLLDETALGCVVFGWVGLAWLA